MTTRPLLTGLMVVLAVIVLVLISLPGICLAQAGPYNPKPDQENDLILPMPGDALMVFRAVAVPGSGYWGSQEQIIQIGDASGGIFEGLQRTQISPSFPRKDGHGRIYLAKYELTKGQFAAIMGLDGLLAASGDSEDQKILQLEGRARLEALMKPLAFVGYHDIQLFIQRYNQWLFDPEHPQRRDNMPEVDGVPGFFRLPTEEEWEFTARGGLPSLEAGTFTVRLPFSQRELNEMVWHLDNAKHQTRPIGLRKPTNLGFYDLFGNVQEMTSGLFRPEIWQGKPGGVAVRGGSVSTPPGTVRSSYREELDVYAWNRDQNSMELRRSYNTGARLAIGSNVVVNTEIRNQLEREYEQYKTEARRVMPVGRTLDNLVAQAAVQLGTVEPILEQLMEQNPHLREPLQSVQVYMDRAKERLDQAQRETARSLTQDAARNGVNISVYLSRLERLLQARDRALQLVEMSSRYQEQLAAVDNSISELETNVQEQLRGYQDKVAQVGEYEQDYRKQALQTLAEQNPSAREQTVLELIADHVAEFAENRRAEPEAWLAAYRERFAGFVDN